MRGRYGTSTGELMRAHCFRQRVHLLSFDMTTNTPVAHVSRKISSRLRELRGMKQEALAEALGISQQAVSKIEQSEHVESATLEPCKEGFGGHACCGEEL